MRKLLLLTVVLIGLSSCGDSAMDKCIDRKVDKGMSAKDARKECRQFLVDEQMRR